MTAAPDIDARLDALATQLHRLTAMVARLCVPVDVIHTADVAKLLGRCEGTVKVLFARGVFTDARPPGRRGKGAPRLTYADEVTVYRAEGEAGVRRLRRELGRTD